MSISPGTRDRLTASIAQLIRALAALSGWSVHDAHRLTDLLGRLRTDLEVAVPAPRTARP